MSIPLYIINMQGCEERWYTTQTRLNSIGMEAERFSATVGKQLSETELQTWYCPSKNKKYYHRDLTKGEIGCYVSHMRIWQKMVDENIAVCVILEDDLFIQPHLKNVIEATLELQHWDLIKLSDNRDFPFIDTATLQDGLTLGNYKKVPNGGQGYILSLEGAKKLLTRKPFYRPVDVDMQFHSEVGLHIIGIKPYPVSEDRSFESEIANVNSGRHSNHSTFLRNLKHRIRLYIQRRDKTAVLAKITADKSH
ncbi:glycosyltransferase family 25 protein [Pseudoalteromonas prydzensis]|uniref:glycosyltransferase family 25 protein n=1 Tax=Pseudoalteromonas prydzensis TaxID=182141 RepID=UPI003703DC1C